MFRTICALFLLLAGCSASHDLTPDQKSKLDGRLQQLLGAGTQATPDDMDMSVRPDGTKEYGVIIHGTSPDGVRGAGIRLNSVFGEIMTARVTIDELRKLAVIKSVRFVETGSTNYPH